VRRTAGAFGVVALLLAVGSGFAAACGSSPRDGGAGDTDAAARAETTSDGAPRRPGVVGFCDTIDASQVEFCADFEHDTAPYFGFDDFGRTDRGSVAITTGEIAGKSSALDFEIVQDAGTQEFVYVAKKLNPVLPSISPVRYEVQLDFRVKGTSTISYAVLVSLGVAYGGPSVAIATYDGNVLSRSLPKTVTIADNHEWHHASLVMTRGPDGALASTRIEIDSTLVDSDGGADGGPNLSKDGAVLIGLLFAGPNDGSLGAQFDNVVIRRW
jgi:hypothetical protein